MRIYLDTSPLNSGHSHRGIGRYTASLQTALQTISEVELVTDPNAADLVHYPYFDLFQPTLPLLPRKKTVVTIHDVIPLQFPQQYQPGVKGSIKLFRQKIALKQVDAVVTDSIASKQHIEAHLSVPSTAIFPIYLASSPAITFQSKQKQLQIQKKYSLPETFALYVGDINYNKNLPMLLEAAAMAKVNLVLVGRNIRPQPIIEWQRVEQTINKHELKLDEDIFLRSDVATTLDLAAIYSAATVYVQPSLAEGFGLPILEAMQCKTPVICFKQSSMKEVGGEYAFYPQSVSAAELATTISTVIKLSISQRTPIIEKASEHARSFSWEKTAKETADVYARVLS